MNCDAYIREELYTNVVCQVARPCRKRRAHHEEDQAGAPIRYGLDDLAGVMAVSEARVEASSTSKSLTLSLRCCVPLWKTMPVDAEGFIEIRSLRYLAHPYLFSHASSSRFRNVQSSSCRGVPNFDEFGL